jgi:hypothetical protein
MKQVAAKLAGAMPDLFGGDAHAYLMAIYNDSSKPDQLRINAAGKALPYEKPRLQATTMTAAPPFSKSAGRNLGCER